MFVGVVLSINIEKWALLDPVGPPCHLIYYQGFILTGRQRLERSIE